MPLAAVSVALTGCTGSSGPATPAPSAVSSAASSDPTAQKVVDRAISATKHVSSYAFVADTTVEAKKSVHTIVRGRVVRGKGLAYRLATGGQRTEVVRTRHATYVRRRPGHWSRLAHPRSLVDPSATLLAVLRGLRSPTTSSGPPGTTRISASLPAAAARDAGLPAEAADARVAVWVDRRGRVVRLMVASGTHAGAQAVDVSVRTSYSHFGRVPAVKPPV